VNNIQKVVDEFSGREVFGEVRSENDQIPFISLSNSTHNIKNINLEDNMIKGDLQFLGNSRGIEAQELFNMGMIKLSIRAFGIPPSDIHKIITWDLVFDEDFKMKKRLKKIDQIITDYEDTDNI
jgi:hypothetical protein